MSGAIPKGRVFSGRPKRTRCLSVRFTPAFRFSVPQRGGSRSAAGRPENRSGHPTAKKLALPTMFHCFPVLQCWLRLLLRSLVGQKPNPTIWLLIQSAADEILLRPEGARYGRACRRV